MSESYELEGKVKVVGETQVFGSGFKKAIVVIEENEGKYPQTIPIEFAGEKGIDLLEDKDLSEGDSVKISFNLRGSEWNGRHFVALQAWRVEVLGSGNNESATPPPPPQNSIDDMEDDIPF